MERHVKNSSAFVDKIQDLEVPPSQKLISYDVTALFTSIPVPDAIKAVQLKLSADDTLSERTSLSIEKILELLKFCLDTTYFVYKNQIYYKQKRGAAMGSPVSPIIANLCMEVFEERALSTAPHPPSLWFRYVDDTFTKIHEYYVDEFTRHINSIDPNIIFTTEPESNGVLPYTSMTMAVLMSPCTENQPTPTSTGTSNLIITSNTNALLCVAVHF